MTQQTRLRSRARISAIAAAAGHAVVFWLFVESLTLLVEDAGAFGRPFTVLLCGFATWLICVGMPDRHGVWRFALAGYLTVALDVAITLAVVTTVLIGRIDLSAITTAIAATVPWALPIWGTLMATVSTAYGLVLHHLQRSAPVHNPSSSPGETYE